MMDMMLYHKRRRKEVAEIGSNNANSTSDSLMHLFDMIEDIADIPSEHGRSIHMCMQVMTYPHTRVVSNVAVRL